MSVITQDIAPVAQIARTRGYWGGVARRLSRDPVSVACAVVLLLIGLADPYQGSMIRRLRPIGTPGYPLGTDELGRDMLSRLIYGGRLTLYIGLLPVIIAFMIGTS